MRRAREAWAGLILTAAMIAAPARAQEDAPGPQTSSRARQASQLNSPGQKVSVSAPASEVFEVAILSDMNGSYGSTSYRPEVHGAVGWLTDAVKPSLVLSTGDMVAGMRRGLDYEAMWRAFHEGVTQPLARAGVPFAPTPGNHDASIQPGYAQERRVYEAQWLARRPAVDMVDEAHYPRRYAFIHRGALFISLDATTVGALPEAQMSWLEAILERHAHVPAKIVFGHLPIHAFAAGREREVLAHERLERLLVRHGVSAYLSGHHHAYYPGRRGALRMVSMPCLGGGARRLMGTGQESARGVALLTIDASRGVLSVESFTGEGFGERVKRETLPRSVGEGERRITRDDL